MVIYLKVWGKHIIWVRVLKNWRLPTQFIIFRDFGAENIKKFPPSKLFLFTSMSASVCLFYSTALSKNIGRFLVSSLCILQSQDTKWRLPHVHSTWLGVCLAYIGSSSQLQDWWNHWYSSIVRIPSALAEFLHVEGPMHHYVYVLHSLHLCSNACSCTSQPGEVDTRSLLVYEDTLKTSLGNLVLHH